MASGKTRKQTKGKSSGRGLPWFAWLGIGLGIVAIIVLVRTFPADQTVSPGGDGCPRAAIIDQLYAFDQPNQKLIDEITDSVESYGFQVDLYQGDEVTVDLYRKLPQHGYKLIIFRTHSGVIKLKGGAIVKTSLFTSEGYDRTRYVREQLNGELAQARVDEGKPFYFAIDAKFIANRMKGRFDNTIIIIAGCSCLYLEDLAQAFIDKGASAYLAWDKAVGLDYVDNATIALIKNLCQGLTIEEAAAKTMEEKGPDPKWGAVLKYYPTQNGKTIKELINEAN